MFYQGLARDLFSGKFFDLEVKNWSIFIACDIGGNSSLCYGGAIMVPIEVIQRYDREMDKKTRMNMERFAEFMARMIEKYGKKVLAEIEKEEAEQQKEQEVESVDYFE